jgi:L-seryl-tRNA(Ser) seleniumtransferase
LGGPQAGLVLGKAEVVERLRRHPLARALRVDKLSLAALEATLRGPTPPTWTALRGDRDQLEQRAERVAAAVAQVVAAEVVSSDGAVGGGGAPALRLPGWAVALPESLAKPLRCGEPAVVGRLDRGRCLLDLRCVPVESDSELVTAILAASGRTPAKASGSAG